MSQWAAIDLHVPLHIVECFELTSSLVWPVFFLSRGISQHISAEMVPYLPNLISFDWSAGHVPWPDSMPRAVGRVAVHGPPLFCLKQNWESSGESSELAEVICRTRPQEGSASSKQRKSSRDKSRHVWNPPSARGREGAQLWSE